MQRHVPRARPPSPSSQSCQAHHHPRSAAPRRPARGWMAARSPLAPARGGAAPAWRRAQGARRLARLATRARPIARRRRSRARRAAARRPPPAKLPADTSHAAPAATGPCRTQPAAVPHRDSRSAERRGARPRRHRWAGAGSEADPSALSSAAAQPWPGARPNAGAALPLMSCRDQVLAAAQPTAACPTHPCAAARAPPA